MDENMTGRRDFIKRCACTACACGFGSFFMFGTHNNNTKEKTDAERKEALALQWITSLLESLEENNLSDSQLRDIVKRTSQAHHDALSVPAMVAPYVGKPKEFIRFLEQAWGWVVTDDTSAVQLTVDENKPVCVCPLLKNAGTKRYPALCYCSEGFAEKMFSAVYQHPVTVTVKSSIQRGNSTCVYLVDYTKSNDFV